jgi:O-antigen/teichoic acid export membrane protein
MSRTRKFVGGVTLGSIQLVLATLVGLWMTPFLLGRLGAETLGFWLVAQQLLGYLLLIDLGVNAVLPREAAYAIGRAQGEGVGDLPHVIARARRAVQLQMPLVLLAASGVAVWIVARYPEQRGPLLFVLAAFVFCFPARLFQSVLQGLQELPFLGKVQIASWSSMTIATIALVVAGAGLWSLVIGWAVAQSVTIAASWLRVERRHHDAWPSGDLKPSLPELRAYGVNAAWISMAQIAQVLLSGSDLLMLGAILGPHAVVLYSCTSKLTSVLANHPQLIMNAAIPALSEHWAAGRRERLVELVTALTLAMLTASGLIVCLTLALNYGFVSWWVGDSQFGGGTLTALLALQLVVRHWNVTLIYGLLAFGLEKRVSIMNLADGIVTVIVGLALIPAVGVAGPVIGSIVAVLATSLPFNLVALAGRTEIGVTSWLRPLWPWAWRLAALGLAASGVSAFWAPTGVIGLSVAGAAVTVVYAAVMAHGLRRSALAPFVSSRLAPWLPRLAGMRAA